jgi:hypothetical protein
LKKLILIFFDSNTWVKENILFLRNVINIGFLISLDFLSRELKVALINSANFNIKNIGDFIIRINEIIGIKILECFKDVIVIVAGVLGIILGLFFTTFLNIITSKYSNINSVIINQLIEQKTINKYFKLLAILVSSSIIFQLLLMIGYQPTIISCLLFTISVIATLLSFIYYGRYSLIYFNAGNLVLDLINSSNQILTRSYKNKKYFNSEKGSQIISGIRRNVEKIRLIAEESTKPQLTNTAFDSISNALLEFAIRYNSFKHTFPSNKGWHPKVQRNKRWDEVSSTELELFSRIGAPLIPETVDDYWYIEKQIINTQFFIFEHLENVSSIVQLIFNQYKYLQIIAFQCEAELFDLFFNKLEAFVEDKIRVSGSEKEETNLQLVSLYANLQIQYLVGFNHNLGKIINKERIKKLAKGIHLFENTDGTLQSPYKIRKWADTYQEKLQIEKYNDNKTLTPLFYTEFELANQIQLLFKGHIEQIAKNIHKRVISFSKKLKDSKHFLESLEFLIESQDVYNKVTFFSGIVEDKIKKEINPLNLKNEIKFNFDERNKLLELNEIYRENVISEIWSLGLSSYSIKNDNLPDIYGNFYQLICEDILKKAFEDEASKLAKYLPHFFTYNVLYIESLREKIDVKRLEYTSSKLYPIIIDLLEISSITILLFKAYDNKELQDSFFSYWDNSFKNDDEKERKFWSIILPIYQFFSQPLFGLSTPSYVREHKRKIQLEEFLKGSKLLRLEEVKGSMMSFMQHYVTDVEDIYFREIVRRLSTGSISGLMFGDLSEIFIEYFLRTRIVLKDLNIKETRYGSDLRRDLETDSE